MSADIKRDEYPSQDDIKDIQVGNLAPQGLRRVFYDLTHNRIVRLGFFGLAIFTLYEGYEGYQHNIPVIKQPINSLATPLAERWRELWKHIGPQSIADLFPNKLEPGEFSLQSQEEMAKLWQNTQPINPTTHTFITGFPATQEIVNNRPDLRFAIFSETRLLRSINPEEKGVEAELKTVQITGFSQGDKISFPYDPTKFKVSVVSINEADVPVGEGPQSFTPAYTSLRLLLKETANGKTYQMNLSALHAKPIKPLAPFFKNTTPGYSNGTPIEPDEPFLELTTNLLDWDGQGAIFPGQRGQITLGSVSMVGDPLSFFNVVFLTDSANHIAIAQ